jgi:hypothetical protein
MLTMANYQFEIQLENETKATVKLEVESCEGTILNRWLLRNGGTLIGVLEFFHPAVEIPPVEPVTDSRLDCPGVRNITLDL